MASPRRLAEINRMRMPDGFGMMPDQGLGPGYRGHGRPCQAVRPPIGQGAGENRRSAHIMPDLFCTALPAAGTTGRALLRLSGPKAADFLDALVSNSVARLAPARPASATLLSSQRKILHDFLVSAPRERALPLEVPPACRPARYD